MLRIYGVGILGLIVLGVSGCKKDPETAQCIASKGYGAWENISETKIENYCPEVAECVSKKGYGHWTGSLGPSLGAFCATSVALKAIEEDRREHPERY
jgi:hypothetical protein